MPAYAVFIREGEIFDPVEMGKYHAANRGNAPKVPIKPLIVYGKTEALEGDAPDGMVVLQFETMEDAKAWYHDPAYQAASVHRRKGAHYRAFFIEGFEPPVV